jgi:DNA-directed RNA polymerase subunit RPC12/RpoP
MNKEVVKCPLCGSDEVVQTKKAGKWWLSFLSMFFLLFVAPVPFLSKIYHCFDCGHEFKHKKTKKA